MKLRALIFNSIIGLAVPFSGMAQLKCPPIAGGTSDSKIDMTVLAGPTFLYGDINHTKNTGYGIALKGDYQVYKGFYAGLEVQAGKLKAVGDQNLSSSKWDPREANNNYLAFIINATVYPYRFMVDERDLMRSGFLERNILNGFYIGLGVGTISNSYSFNARKREQLDFYDFSDIDNPVERHLQPGDINGPHDVGRRELPSGHVENYTVYRTTASDMLLPVVNVGLAVPLSNKRNYGTGFWSVVIQSQFNFANGENLDGYDPRLPSPDGATDYQVGPRRTGAKNDMYNFTSVGLKYKF